VRFSIKQPATPNLGTAVVNLGSVVDPNAYVPGNYRVNFTTDTAGQLMVSATLISGEPPVASEVLAPTPYVDGSSITFNGMEMSVTGAPQAGDSFSISCSDESVFSTIQRMITNLNKPYGNVVSNAQIQTENTQIYSQLDNAFNTILNYQSDLGARLNQLDSAESSNSSLILISQETLKQLREINPTEVAVQYNLQLVNLQAAQQSFVRIQGLSVFNYL
ncbi:MAG: flagellin, partial [bacterium]|nr:flagellin [bacterium]